MVSGTEKLGLREESVAVEPKIDAVGCFVHKPRVFESYLCDP